MLGIASWNDNIIILDASNFSSQQILQRISSPTSQLMAVRWSPDSSQIVASSFDEITVWDVFTGNIINTIPTSQSIVETDPQAIDYSSSGQLTYINQDASIVIAPITNAGVDQSIMDADNNGSELVNLDASLSSDSDGTIVSYEWTENGISIATGINPQVNFGVGVHQIVLTVTDDDGATGADVVAITIEANTPTCDSTISASDTTPNSSQR